MHSPRPGLVLVSEPTERCSAKSTCGIIPAASCPGQLDLATRAARTAQRSAPSGSGRAGRSASRWADSRSCSARHRVGAPASVPSGRRAASSAQAGANEMSAARTEASPWGERRIRRDASFSARLPQTCAQRDHIIAPAPRRPAPPPHVPEQGPTRSARRK